MPNFKASLVHGFKVALHIIVAMAVGALGYVLLNPAGVASLTSLLEHYGLAVGLINVIIATGVHYYQQIPPSATA